MPEELEAGGCHPEEMRWLVPSIDSSTQVQYIKAQCVARFNIVFSLFQFLREAKRSVWENNQKILILSNEKLEVYKYKVKYKLFRSFFYNSAHKIKKTYNVSCGKL